MSMPPPGTGQRFHALEDKLAHRAGVHDPAALAAYIGRRKYGKQGFADLSHHGVLARARKRIVGR